MTRSGLRLAPALKLPVDVAGEALAILAKRGAGKTNTATVLVEEMHAAGIQLVILDPVGAWWGIRSSADGAKEGLEVAVLGGVHGDVPLEQTAGALIADVAVDSGQSLLLDLSDFPSKAAMARFVVDFAERLFRRKNRDKSLLHLVLEEADTFAPQTGKGDDARMRGAIEQIVRRGRSRGLGITMVTQRSAVLNKDVLSQADVLIAMRTTSPHDTAAIKLWVSAHGDDEAGVVASLPSLETGEAWVWNPERGLLDRVQVRPRRTFDSSATPKAGETRKEPKRLAAFDVELLGEQIRQTAERAKENDPAELRKRIRDLERQVAELEQRPATTEVERVEVPVPVLAEGQVEKFEKAIAELDQAQGEFLAGVSGRVDMLGDLVDGFRQELARVVSAYVVSTYGPESIQAKVSTVAQRERKPPTSPASAVEGLTGPEQRVLDAIAWFAALGIHEPGKGQVGFIAGYRVGKRVGGTYTVTLTAIGELAARDPGIEQTNEGLQAAVLERLNGPEQRVLEHLIRAYPRPLSKQELGTLAGYQVGDRVGGTYGNILGRLRSLGLIDYPSPGDAIATAVVFPLGA